MMRRALPGTGRMLPGGKKIPSVSQDPPSDPMQRISPKLMDRRIVRLERLLATVGSDRCSSFPLGFFWIRLD